MKIRQETQSGQTNQDDDLIIPNEFYCPITLQIMTDPVILEDGISYERKAIQSWLNKQCTSPATGRKLTNKKLTPNLTLRNSIVSFKQNFLPLINEHKKQGKYLKNIIKFKQTVLNQKQKEYNQLSKQKQDQKHRSQILENQLCQERQFKSQKQQQLIMRNLVLANQLFKQRQEKMNRIDEIKQLKRLGSQPLKYQAKISTYNQKLQNYHKQQIQLQQQLKVIQQNHQQSILQTIVQFFLGSKTLNFQQVEYLDSRYRGKMQNNQPHGIGRMVDSTNSIYIGNFYKGQKTGFGKQKWNSGDFYKGQFLEGKAQGFGMYRWRQQNLKQQYYQGDFKDDELDGFGKMYYRGTSEKRYQGQWKQGKRHGYGMLFYRNQQIYAGNFQNNLKHGQGKFIDYQGKQYSQVWQKGTQCSSIILQQ